MKRKKVEAFAASWIEILQVHNSSSYRRTVEAFAASWIEI